jgi:flagellar hook-associated protein 2
MATLASTTASQGAFTSTAAQNSDFLLNGVELHRTSNTVSDAVDGVTFTLNKAQTDLTQTTGLSVGLDSNAASTSLQGVVSAYNQFRKDYSSNAKFTQNTDGSYTAGVFNMDMTIQNMVNQVSSALMNAAPGMSSSALYTTPAAVGLKTNEDGTISLDSGAFQTAFNANSQAVINLFAPSGTSTDPLLSFVSANTKTTTNPIQVQVSQSASGTYTGVFSTKAADGSAYTATLTSTDGTFYGATGTPLEGLVLAGKAGANGTVSASGGINANLQALDNALSSLNPGDIGGLMNDLSSQNSDLNMQIAQQQNYLTNSKAALEATYSNLETSVSSLQSASSSLSTLA